MKKALTELQNEIGRCRLCPRLVLYREEVGARKRRAYRNEEYWGRPVPSLGDLSARLLLVGLAPGAHGANRTGRMFTGDRSGAFLYPTLFRFGFSNKADSSAPGDGLELDDCYITAALHCVPPANKPGRQELESCRPYLVRELRLLTNLRVIIALGGIAWKTVLTSLGELGYPLTRPRPKFGHAMVLQVKSGLTLIGSYHPSQQNTQTGRLTQPMFDQVFAGARELLSDHDP